MNKEEIQKSLSQFKGTADYHMWSILTPYMLTDGAKYIADKCEAYWLMDAIASYAIDLFGEDFQVWKLTVKD